MLQQTEEDLRTTIRYLYETVWKGQMSEPHVNAWLKNFEPEAHHLALHLLSQFMFFGLPEMRELMKAVYRDFVEQPAVQRIREQHGGTLDHEVIDPALQAALKATRVFGMGGPSESGTHLLYYFRQINGLPVAMFPQSVVVHGPGGRTALREPAVSRYIFFDDFCGSGEQASQYSDEELPVLRSLNGSATAEYVCLFGFNTGLQRLRDENKFSSVTAIFTLDHTFKCFDPMSRYYLPDEAVERDEAKELMSRHGLALCGAYPLGYADSQLLLGFFHNTPDNTLPVMWAESAHWMPAFPRFTKVYK